MNYIEYKVKVYANGTKEWRFNGKLHREDGPAFEDVNGNKEWYLNSALHREGGPAIERTDGTRRWFLNDREYTEADCKAEVARRKQSCEGKVVEIEGKKYRLTEVKEGR